MSVIVFEFLPWDWFLVSDWCGPRKCLIWFQFSWICWGLFCFLSCGLSLKMFHVHLKRMYVLLVRDTRFYTFLLTPFLFLKLFYCCSIIVVWIFSPPQRNPPPSPASTLPIVFVHVSFIVVLKTLLPTIPSPFHSGYCKIVLNFNDSGYILFVFLFSWLCSS